MECYRKGLTGVQANYVLKKYKSHRTVSENIDELNKLTLAGLQCKLIM